MRVLIGILYYFILGHLALGAQPGANVIHQKCVAERINLNEGQEAPPSQVALLQGQLPTLAFKLGSNPMLTLEVESYSFDLLPLPVPDGQLYEHTLSMRQSSTSGIVKARYTYQEYTVVDDTPTFYEKEVWSISDCKPQEVKQ